MAHKPRRTDTHRERRAAADCQSFHVSLLLKDARNCMLFLAWDQMEVATMRLFTEVSDPLLKHALVNAIRRTDTNERMTKHMPALQLVPFSSP